MSPKKSIFYLLLLNLYLIEFYINSENKVRVRRRIKIIIFSNNGCSKMRVRSPEGSMLYPLSSGLRSPSLSSRLRTLLQGGEGGHGRGGAEGGKDGPSLRFTFPQCKEEDGGRGGGRKDRPLRIEGGEGRGVLFMPYLL